MKCEKDGKGLRQVKQTVLSNLSDAGEMNIKLLWSKMPAFAGYLYIAMADLLNSKFICFRVELLF